MSKYSIVFLIFFLFGCTNVKNIYNVKDLDLNDKAVQYTLKETKAKNDYNSIVYFTTGFTKDTIELVNGNESLFKLPIETIGQLGLAMTQTVDNTKEVKINIKLSKPVEFVLNPVELKKHKFIYINRVQGKNKFVVEYSNVVKRFL